MAVYNYAGGEINVKIVYYGPGVSGKTTNLEHMYSKLPKENKGKMVSMKTRTDRTLFFDFLPIEIGDFKGMKVRFLLYTVPGQVYYNATRRLVLKGVDAIVFVADTSPGRMDENKESLANLKENLDEIGISLSEVPWVMQYNKRDVEGCISREVLDRELNTRNVEAFEAVATTGQGVYETFECIARKVFVTFEEGLNRTGTQEENSEDPSFKEGINVEVVAQGVPRNISSETDASESLGYAEEREEEHKSVSEFVNNMLKEEDESVSDEGIDPSDAGDTRDSYKEFGHVVELGGGSNDDEECAMEASVSVATEEKERDFIKDPLDNFSDESKGSESPGLEEDSLTGPLSLEKLVNVQVEISEEEIRTHIPVKIVLKIKVT